jgi:hypothetical protein
VLDRHPFNVLERARVDYANPEATQAAGLMA